MKKTLITITLSLATQLVLADGFASWAERVTDHEISAGASVAAEFAGFAPWRSETIAEDVAAAPLDTRISDRMTDNSTSVFRPWS